MRRVALIGHRGVGKTAFLSRVASYCGSDAVTCLDLDREVAARAGRTISDIFQKDGEVEFRRQERDVFRDVDVETARSTKDVYLALGAGFDPALLPESWTVLWIRRATDPRGRVFIDRPRLNSRVPPLEEFNERFHRRQAAYQLRADEVLFLDEGLESPEPAERDFLLGSFRDLGGTITLLPQHFRTEANFVRWAKARLRWGVTSFELRDDLLTEEQFATALRVLPDDRVLISFRSLERLAMTSKLIEQHGLAFDWPVENGACDIGEPTLLSTHRRDEGESISQALARLSGDGPLLKAALPTYSFAELEEGRSWQQEAPDKRIFLPHSADGRWSWDRLLESRSQPLGFFREGDGSGVDQPTLLQWARQKNAGQKNADRNFAAVLGDPVAHSRTPLEQREFFAKRSCAVYAIRVEENEWTKALSHLQRRGLTHAAVTAPLKTLAFTSCETCDERAQQLRAVNTLLFKHRWIGTNTDLEGFTIAVREAGVKDPIAVWGGGGTLEVIKSVLPQAQFYSLRTGSLRTGANREGGDGPLPETVIWAVGGPRAELNSPPESWKPQLIFDLNYAEDSPGRTYALEKAAKYVSGLSMFRAQAAAQRRFWESHEEKK